MPGMMDRVKTRVNLARHSGRVGRRLEIGPGPHAIEGFETLNIVGGRWVDYVGDAARDLPFDEGVFELVYASHVLEHIPWYQSEGVLAEWVRVLGKGGRLEVWVPDGLKICRAMVAAEDEGDEGWKGDGWRKFNEDNDVCKWAAGRLFTYGDGEGTTDHPNWHRAMFTPRYLKGLFEGAGLRDVRVMDAGEVRGADHGWINLGVTGVKG